MESDEALRQLREAERGEVSAWLLFARPEWWQPLVFAVWAALLVLSLGLLDGAPRSVATVIAIAVPLLYLHVDRGRRPLYPSGRMPREFRRSTWLLVALGPVAALLAGQAYFMGGVWVAALVAALTTAVVVEAYGRVYASDAERVRRRLA